MRLYVKPSTLLLTIILLFTFTLLLTWHLLFPSDKNIEEKTEEPVITTTTYTDVPAVTNTENSEIYSNNPDIPTEESMTDTTY